MMPLMCMERVPRRLIGVCCLNDPSVGEENVTGCDAVGRDSSESVWTSSRGVYTMYGTVEKVQHSLQI